MHVIPGDYNRDGSRGGCGGDGGGGGHVNCGANCPGIRT